MARKEPDRLSLESSAAIAAGMSYGKWKEMQKSPVTIEKTAQKKKPTADMLICKWCGEPFMPKTKRAQLYCRESCQEAAYRARNKQKIAAQYKDWKNRKEQRNESNA